MSAHVQAEVGALYEGLAAHAAHVGPLACVRARMRVQRRLLAEPTQDTASSKSFLYAF